MIPKIIHQTWKTKQIPDRFVRFVHSWKSHHPSWEYRLWDDNENLHFMKTCFPWFLPVYNNYSLNIQRADAVRYFILYHHGGVYVDIDFDCCRPIDLLIEKKTCLFGTEASGHCINYNVEQIISNAFMATTPRHPFFYEILKDLLTYIPKQKNTTKAVLETTGPMMLNRVYDACAQKTAITLIPSRHLFPLTDEESERLRMNKASTAILNKLKEAYGIHHHMGTWWKDGTIGFEDKKNI